MSGWWHRARGLYAIVDPEHCAGRAPTQVAAQILEGGCAALQFRAKHLDDRDLLSLARELRELCAASGVPFVVNDRADIARLANADGLHLGQDDLPVSDARKTVGNMCIGVSTHGPSQAIRAVEAGADLIGAGPVFGTRSKARPDPVIGIEGLREICAEVDVPVVAIGGITSQNVDQVVACGLPLVAAISSVVGAEQIEEASRTLHELARSQRSEASSK